MVSTVAIHPVQHVEFDGGLIRRLSQSGPRYTSYPTADRFHDGFGYRDYLQTVTPVSSATPKAVASR